MTNEEAIAFLSQYIDNECYTDKCQQAHYMAISAIRAAEKCDQNETEMRPGCNPLTLDQLREMVDKPVYLYIYSTATDSGWHIIKAVTEDKIIFRGRNTMYVPISSIGKSFDLYAYPPAHIDREAWSKYCPKCKYEDDNEGIPIYYSSDWDGGIGFESDDAIFCPKCGRPLTTEAWDKLKKRIEIGLEENEE